MELNQQLKKDQRLDQKLDQQMVLAPQVIQSIEILQKPRLELRDAIKQEMETNPALVTKQEDEDQMEDPEDELVDQEEEEEEDDEFDEEDLLDLLEERDLTRSNLTESAGSGYNQEAADRKMEALYNTPATEPGLQEQLKEEIQMEDVSDDVQQIAEYLIYNLDESGYLQVSLEEAVDMLNEEVLETARDFVDEVQETDPASVEADSLPAHFYEDVQDDAAGALKTRVLDNMDEEGKLMRPLEEVLRPDLVSYGTAEEALELIQEIGPAGTAARDKEECLLLQLDDEDEQYESKRTLIEEHLEDLEENRMKKVARNTDLEVEEVSRLAEEIRELDPNPGFAYSARPAREVDPDVVVQQSDGEYEVMLNDSYVPEITVSRKYLNLLKDDNLSDEAKDYLKEKIQKARHFQNSIQQRRETIRKIAECIVDKQEEFLEKGINYLKPMKMKEVAEEVGCHLSTVSRATDGKYIQTPWKIMGMKDFFSGGTETEEGEEKSRVTVMNRLKTIIEEEDKSDPLSDSDIADRLEEKYGIDIARRTVNKYRKKLDIPSSTKRKKY